MTPEAFVDLFAAQRASAILRTASATAAEPAMTAAVEAGFRIIEFTLTTPNALSLIAKFAAMDDLVVGAGTVLTTDEADAAADAGARFIVSPVVDEAVIGRTLGRGLVAMPGTHTPTEMMRAHRAGAQLQKLFPAPGNGAKYVKACLGPMPFLRIVPTNGVHLNNVSSYIKAGVHAVGFVNPLFDPNEMRDGRFDRIEKRGRQLLEAIRGV